MTIVKKTLSKNDPTGNFYAFQAVSKIKNQLVHMQPSCLMMFTVSVCQCVCFIPLVFWNFEVRLSSSNLNIDSWFSFNFYASLLITYFFFDVFIWALGFWNLYLIDPNVSIIYQIHIYGTSLGGFLAQLFAQHRPRRVKSLVLSNTFLDTSSFSRAMPWAPV